MTRHALLLALAVAATLAPGWFDVAAGPGDLAFLRPWFEPDRRERETLAQRGVVVRTLPAADRQLGVLAVTPISIDAETFARRMRSSGVKHPRMISGQFSTPPVLEDLAPVWLDEGDLDRLRRLCRPGDCRFNLAQHEIAAVQRALAADGAGASERTQQAFRQLVFDRTGLYLKGGLEALPDYQDRGQPVRPAAAFAEILRQSPYLRTHVPRLAAYLERFPNADANGVESFLRWSRATVNDKGLVTVTHVALVRPAPAPAVPAVLVAGKQVYASRYMNGELTLTMLFQATTEEPAYLVHVSRSDLDELGGSFSGIRRSLIAGRIKEEAAGALATLRDGLERDR